MSGDQRFRILRRPRVVARYVTSQEARSRRMRTIGATTCRVLGHAWTPLEYMRFRMDKGNDGAFLVSYEAGPVYIGCARCLVELPPHPPRTPAPIDIVDR